MLHGEDAEDLRKRMAAGVILHEGGSTAAIRRHAAVGAAGAERGEGEDIVAHKGASSAGDVDVQG